MFLYMIWSTNAVGKSIVVLLLFIKVLWGLSFLKAEHEKWIKLFFILRVGYDIIIIGPVVLVMLGAQAMNVVSTFMAVFLIILSEGILLLFIYKFLKPNEIKTLIPELLEIEEHKKKMQEFYDLHQLQGKLSFSILKSHLNFSYLGSELDM